MIYSNPKNMINESKLLEIELNNLFLKNIFIETGTFDIMTKTTDLKKYWKDKWTNIKNTILKIIKAILDKLEKIYIFFKRIIINQYNNFRKNKKNIEQGYTEIINKSNDDEIYKKALEICNNLKLSYIDEDVINRYEEFVKKYINNELPSEENIRKLSNLALKDNINIKTIEDNLEDNKLQVIKQLLGEEQYNSIVIQNKAKVHSIQSSARYHYFNYYIKTSFYNEEINKIINFNEIESIIKKNKEYYNKVFKLYDIFKDFYSKVKSSFDKVTNTFEETGESKQIVGIICVYYSKYITFVSECMNLICTEITKTIRNNINQCNIIFNYYKKVSLTNENESTIFDNIQLI